MFCVYFTPCNLTTEESSSDREADECGVQESSPPQSDVCRGRAERSALSTGLQAAPHLGLRQETPRHKLQVQDGWCVMKQGGETCGRRKGGNGDSKREVLRGGCNYKLFRISYF